MPDFWKAGIWKAGIWKAGIWKESGVAYAGSITSIEVAPRLVSLIVGQTDKAVAVSYQHDHNVVVEDHTYASDNAGVATVHPTTGVITAIGLGTATITATGVDSGLTATGEVRVMATPNYSSGGRGRSPFTFARRRR